jgi:Protein of unknown function (DUF3102)
MIAVKCGELLAKKKDSLSHGQWLPWVKRNLPFTDRTARRYIKVWHNRQTLKEEERHKLTLRQFCFVMTDSKSARLGLLQARQATNDSSHCEADQCCDPKTQPSSCLAEPQL